jgi:hypothetical protein
MPTWLEQRRSLQPDPSPILSMAMARLAVFCTGLTSIQPGLSGLGRSRQSRARNDDFVVNLGGNINPAVEFG